MNFVRQNTLLHQLIIVDGIGQSGKGLLSSVISCFNRVEKQQYNPILEYIAMAHKYKKISKDIAVAILKTEIDTALYNNMIGRNINSRMSDDTSLYKYHSPEKYLKRSLETDGSIIADKVFEQKPIYLCWTHDLIHKADIIFEAFQDKLNFFYINRRPIDIIYEWHFSKNYSDRMSKDSTEMQFCIQYQDTAIPEIAFGWEEEYLTCNALERTIKFIHSFFKLNYSGILNAKQKHNLHLIDFDTMVTMPEKIVEYIQSVIHTEPLPALDQVLYQANCPRIRDEKKYTDRKYQIENMVSSIYKNLIAEAEDFYQNIKNCELITCSIG